MTYSVSSLSGNRSLFPNFSLIKSRTFLTSHTNIHLGLGDFKFNTPDTNEHILGYITTSKPSITSWTAELAGIC